MEHCSDFKHNKQTEIKIKKTCAIIARVFMILFVLSAIGLLAYLGASVYSFISNNDASLLSIFYPTILYGLCMHCFAISQTASRL